MLCVKKGLILPVVNLIVGLLAQNGDEAWPDVWMMSKTNYR